MGEGPDTQHRQKQHAPAAERNAAPILDVLRQRLPVAGKVLEIASGSGQHACHFARALPQIVWQPSDRDAGARASIHAWRDDAGLENLQAPLDVDVMDPGWSDALDRQFDAVVAINLIHVAPWPLVDGLLGGAAHLLVPGGLVYLYGPYKRDGVHTAPSNARFEDWLHAQDPEWGVRDMADIGQVGAKHGLRLERAIDMPANNFSLILKRA